MVSFAGSLPKGDANGLEAHSRALVEALPTGAKFFVVGVLHTHAVKTGSDLVPVPTAAFSQVELIGLNSGLEEPAAKLLRAAQSERVGGPGQQEFDLAADSAPGEPDVGPLELSEGPGYFFQVVDSAPGRFDLLLCTQHISGVRVRRGLQREEFGELPPGEYQLFELELSDAASSSLRGLGEVLIEEWESNTGTAVVDAEVVDEDEDGDSDA